MATLHFELVSPEKLVFSGEVDQVDVPGTEGDFGVLAGHAPMVTTLRPGILTVIMPAASKQQLVVLGGFAEVSDKGLTVLADLADSVEDFDRRRLRRTSARWKQRIAKTEPGSRARQADHAARSLQAGRSASAGTAMH